MQFCPIAPTSCLAEFCGDSNTHLVLAQYCDDANYLGFYRGRARAGDVVILDNGAYEGHTLDYAQYLEVALDLRPTFLVWPDVVGERAATFEKIREFRAFLQKAKGGSHNITAMAVVQDDPQAELLQWVDVYLKLRLEFNGIAFPRVLGQRRVELVEYLVAHRLRAQHSYWHCMGMNAGSLVELPKLAALHVDSIDSSAPVWRGLCGYKIEDPAWPDITFNPHASNEGWCSDLAHHNLNKVLTACNFQSARQFA